MSKSFWKNPNPPLVFVLMELGVSFKTAMIAAALLQIVVVIVLLVAISMFAEWRYVQWVKLGCSAYCNCTQRFANMTYTF